MSCLYAVVNGNSQMNQAETSNNWKVLNWGDGTNTTDVGCRYAIHMVDAEVKNDPTGIDLPEVGFKDIEVRDSQFFNAVSGSAVNLFTVDGRRVAAQTGNRLRGIYILCDAGRTCKVVYP